VQFEVYEIGKRHAFEPLRDWFKALYEVLFGQSQGPRFGSFAVLFGCVKTAEMIEQALAAANSEVGGLIASPFQMTALRHYRSFDLMSGCALSRRKCDRFLPGWDIGKAVVSITLVQKIRQAIIISATANDDISTPVKLPNIAVAKIGSRLQ
jgi:hypothetical protein